MKKYILITVFFGATNLFAQQGEVYTYKKDRESIMFTLNEHDEKIKDLDSIIQAKFKELETLVEKVDSIYKMTDSLTNNNIKKITDSLTNNIKEITDSLTNNIKEITDSLTNNIKEIKEKSNKSLDSKLSKSSNRLYWILATLATLLLGGLMYLFIGKRIKYSKTDVETQIRNTKKSLEEKSVKLDSKLIDIIEIQLETEKAKTPPKDHSFFLKVTDEVVRIQNNLRYMDEKTKGLKQLTASVKRILNNLEANGYKLVDMIGKEYNEGMKVTVNFIQDEDFEEGKIIITRIIKPQVNYNGKMIQVAEIEVTENIKNT